MLGSWVKRRRSGVFDNTTLPNDKASKFEYMGDCRWHVTALSESCQDNRARLVRFAAHLSRIADVDGLLVVEPQRDALDGERCSWGQTIVQANDTCPTGLEDSPTPHRQKG